MRILALYDLKGDHVTPELRQKIQDRPEMARRFRFQALMETKGYRRVCNAFSVCSQHSIVWESVDCDIPEHDRQKACPTHVAKVIQDQNPDIIIALGATARDCIPEDCAARVFVTPHPEVSNREADAEFIQAREDMEAYIHEKYAE